MLQAASKSITRRSVIAGAALALPTVPALALTDPIFAAIERCRKAYDRLEPLALEQDALWHELPESRRTWSFHVDDQTPPNNCGDDPRWIAIQINGHEANSASFFAIKVFSETQPTTLAGVLAAIRYAAECEDGGQDWSGGMYIGDDPENGRAIYCNPLPELVMSLGRAVASLRAA